VCNVRRRKYNEEESLHWVLDKKISEGKGYTLVNCDTDSISYTNGIAPTEEEFKNEINEINSLMHDFIKFEDDGVFTRAIVVRAKNYLLMKKTGEITTKGSAFKSSTKEPALKEFLDEITKEILKDNKIENLNPA
jgi:DNA polymerase elongation subunit (family B)